MGALPGKSIGEDGTQERALPRLNEWAAGGYKQAKSIGRVKHEISAMVCVAVVA